MANLLEIDPVYTTIQDYKDTTSVAALQTATDDELKAIIYNAQLIIDNYIIAFGLPCVEGQDFIFPTILSDDTCEVPTNISIATVYIWDVYYENMNASSWTNIKTEKTWDYSVEYSDSKEDSSIYINQKAMLILDKYKLLSANISI